MKKTTHRPGRKRHLLATLRGETGMIDVSSVMAGITVLGVLGGVVAATVFAVIPWAQDNAARADLGQVRLAEGVYAASNAGGYADLATIQGPSSFAGGSGAPGQPGASVSAAGKPLLPTFDAARQLKINANQNGFVASEVSQTGRTFYVTSLSPNVSSSAPTVMPAGLTAPSSTTTTTATPIVYKTVSTLAGDGSNSIFDGTSYGYPLGQPSLIAVDSSGNVFMPDHNNNVIRKVSPSGVITTFAGSNTNSAATVNGQGSAARFSAPTGIAIDAANNLYVSEASNDIRKITPGGLVTTFAGSGVRGYADGAAGVAQFNGAVNLWAAADGNIYVADTLNYRIRKITPAGVVSTIAGSGQASSLNGTGTAASFAYPYAIVGDKAGNLFVSDKNSTATTIRKITPAGVVTTFAGGGVGIADGTGTNAGFGRIQGLAIDPAGNLFATQIDPATSGGLIREVSPAGVVTTIAGNNSNQHTDGPVRSAAFRAPWGIAIAPDGSLFVADTNPFFIRKIS